MGLRNQPATFEKIPTSTLLRLKKGDRIYRQYDSADAMFRVEEGVVGFSVVSGENKEALLALLGPGSFFGDGRLAVEGRLAEPVVGGQRTPGRRAG